MITENGERQLEEPNFQNSQSQERDRSTIAFPYMDLADAVAVAQGIHSTTGAGPCQHDQLAAALSLSMNSSGFRVRLSTARMFGLIEIHRGKGTVRLTPLGQMIVDDASRREAMVEAFMNIPLYKELYERYRGRVLPPSGALQTEMATLGVARKQTDKARQTFERTAEVAGFFQHGRDRLVAPGFQKKSDDQDEEVDFSESGRAGSKSVVSTERHALIEALVDILPPADGEMSIEELADWLRAAEVNMRLVYRIKGRISVEVVNQQSVVANQ